MSFSVSVELPKTTVKEKAPLIGGAFSFNIIL
jgi:hypothetical protein